MRSPSYGKVRRPRPPRELYVVDVMRCGPHLDGLVLVTVQEPGCGPLGLPARDYGHAVCLVDLLKQGMWSREVGMARPPGYLTEGP